MNPRRSRTSASRFIANCANIPNQYGASVKSYNYVTATWKSARMFSEEIAGIKMDTLPDEAGLLS